MPNETKSPLGRHLLNHGRDVQNRQPGFRIIVAENENATTRRVDGGMISRRHVVFATVARPDHKRDKGRAMQQFANSLNHAAILSSTAEVLKETK